MSDDAQITVVGTCDTRPRTNEHGWTEFEVAVPGKQYPVRMSTKLEKLVDEGQAAFMEGTERAWTYTERDGNENPNRPGTFYKNRTLQKVEEVTDAHRAATATGGSGSAQGGGKGWQPRSPEENDLIVRQVAIKAAVELVVAVQADMPSDTSRTLYDMAGTIAEFIWATTPNRSDLLSPAEQKAAEETPPPSDDDIPF